MGGRRTYVQRRPNANPRCCKRTRLFKVASPPLSRGRAFACPISFCRRLRGHRTFGRRRPRRARPPRKKTASSRPRRSGGRGWNGGRGRGSGALRRPKTSGPKAVQFRRVAKSHRTSSEHTRPSAQAAGRKGQWHFWGISARPSGHDCEEASEGRQPSRQKSDSRSGRPSTIAAAPGGRLEPSSTGATRASPSSRRSVGTSESVSVRRHLGTEAGRSGPTRVTPGERKRQGQRERKGKDKRR